MPESGRATVEESALGHAASFARLRQEEDPVGAGLDQRFEARVTGNEDLIVGVRSGTEGGLNLARGDRSPAPRLAGGRQCQNRGIRLAKSECIAAGAGGDVAATFNRPIDSIVFAIGLMLPFATPLSLLCVALSRVTATYIGRALFGALPSGLHRRDPQAVP